MDPQIVLDEGLALLTPLLAANGFTWNPGLRGTGSGGPFAAGSYVKADRELSLSFRHSLGLVTYRIGGADLAHEVYMRALVGSGDFLSYPGFSDDPLDGFRHLRADLEQYGADFLAGDGSRFAECLRAGSRGGARLP